MPEKKTRQLFLHVCKGKNLFKVSTPTLNGLAVSDLHLLLYTLELVTCRGTRKWRMETKPFKCDPVAKHPMHS